jgi:hypothetical protein
MMSFFAVDLGFGFLFVILCQLQLPVSTSISILEQGVAEDHLGRYQRRHPFDPVIQIGTPICVPAPIFIFRQWQPAKPRTGMSNFPQFSLFDTKLRLMSLH